MTPRSILYVDDDTSNLLVFEAALGRELSVLTTSQPELALELMREHGNVAVLLTDQRMPGMSGVELAQRAREQFPDTLRYLITAYSDLDAAVDAINLGMVRRYFRKPWDLDELRGALLDGLEVYDLRDRTRRMERRLLEVERVYALGVVAASIAHELRNPITALGGELSRIKRGVGELEQACAGDTAAKARDVRAHVEAAEQTIDRLIDVARGVEHSTRRAAPQESADLREVVQVTLAMLRSELVGRASVCVEMNDVPRVRGSNNKLGQVVLNLLTNALEAIGDRRHGELGVITVRGRGEGTTVVLEVQDTGLGIPPDVAAQIFNPFFTTKEHGGTGLGLAVSRQIVEEAGGTLDLVPRRDAKTGACFRVCLLSA